MQDLLRGIKKILAGEIKKTSQHEAVIVQRGVAGTTANAQVLRGNMALEDYEWQKADGFFEEALNLDPRCAEAYIANRWRPDSEDSFDGPAMIGIFPMRGERAVIDLEEVMAEGGVTLAAIVQDGRYENIVDGTPVEVIKGRICTDGRAVILRTQ